MSKENKNKEKQRNSAGYESRTGKVREQKAIATPAGVSVLSLMPKVGQGSRAHSLSVSVPCVLHHQSFQLAAHARRGLTVER